MRPPALLTEVLDRLLAVVAPPRCLGCLTEATWLCRRCQDRIDTYPLSCVSCSKPHPRGLTCENCRAATPLHGVISVGSYRNVLLQRGIGWLKYKGVQDVAPILSALLLPRLLAIAPWEELQRLAVLVPIPLHRRKQRERGFNQSQAIAAAINQATNIPVAPLLVRDRSTWTQSKLPSELRHDNVSTAFSLAASPTPERTMAIIIDDVTTTGSTLSAAAGVLHRANIPILWGATIARG